MKSTVSNLLFLAHIVCALVFCVIIIFLNFSLIRFWFEGEFSQNMGSIEISYIQMAKFWAEGGSLWRQWWYLGHPWHVFYTPLLPFLELGLFDFFNVSFGHAYRLITGVGYVLVPVSVFLFVWQIAKSKTGAFVSALFYSFVPSVIALLFDEVAADSLSGGLEPRRFAILVRWGEGPHTLALVFVPIFGLFLARFLKNAKFLDLFLTCMFLGLSVLTNAISVWVCALLSLSFLMTTVVDKENLIIVLKKFGQVFLLTFGLLAFWYNLPFVSTFFSESGGALGNWLAIFPWGFVVLSFGITAVFLVTRKLFGKFSGVPLSIFWFLMLFFVVYVYYASGQDHLEYAPQALRLNTEVDLALSVLVGTVVSNIYLFLQKRLLGLKAVGSVLGLLIVSFISFFILQFGWKLLGKLPVHTKDISTVSIKSPENSSEFRIAKKLEEATRGTDERVVAPGNYGFWLNYFVSVPQIRGALYQSSAHFWPEHIYYQLTSGSDAQVSLAWLKIANVGKVVFTGPGSPELYKDFKVPVTKFSGILNEQYQEGGDIIFSVPLKNNSLAKVVDFEAISAISKPKNAIDSEPIFAYVGELEKNSQKKVMVLRESESKMKIVGQLNAGEAILVQETYDPGWKVKGGGWKVLGDPLDFLLLSPKKEGAFEIDLIYSKPFTVYFGYAITFITLILVIKNLFFKKLFWKRAV